MLSAWPFQVQLVLELPDCPIHLTVRIGFDNFQYANRIALRHLPCWFFDFKNGVVAKWLRQRIANPPSWVRIPPTPLFFFLVKRTRPSVSFHAKGPTAHPSSGPTTNPSSGPTANPSSTPTTNPFSGPTVVSVFRANGPAVFLAQPEGLGKTHQQPRAKGPAVFRSQSASLTILIPLRPRTTQASPPRTRSSSDPPGGRVSSPRLCSDKTTRRLSQSAHVFAPLPLCLPTRISLVYYPSTLRANDQSVFRANRRIRLPGQRPSSFSSPA